MRTLGQMCKSFGDIFKIMVLITALKSNRCCEMKKNLKKKIFKMYLIYSKDSWGI